MPKKKPAKRKGAKKPPTLLQQVSELRDALMDKLHDALDEVFDKRPDPPLPGGQRWHDDLGDDLQEVINDFEEEAKEDVREAVLKLAKAALKKPKK